MNPGALAGAAWKTADGCADKSCVEVAFAPGVVGVRDTKTGGVLAFTPGEWRTFLAGAKAGEFDPPA